MEEEEGGCRHVCFIANKTMTALAAEPIRRERASIARGTPIDDVDIEDVSELA